MIIDKVRELLTDEELKRQDNIVKDTKLKNSLGQFKNKDGMAVLAHLISEIRSLDETAKKRYRDTKGKDKKLLLKDIKEIAEALTKEDHYTFIGQKKRVIEDLAVTLEDLKKMKEAGATPSEYLEVSATDTPEGARLFIAEALGYPYRLYTDTFKDKKTEDIIDAKILEWYPENKFKLLEGDNIPNITTSYPDTELKAITRLNMQFFDTNKNWQDFRGKQVYVDIAPNNKNINAKVMLTIDPDITSDLKLTNKDEGILSSAVSLAYNNDHGIVTAHEVAKYFYYGNSKTARPSPQQVSAVKKKLDLYGNNRITIDYTEHAKLNGRELEDGERAEISRYVFPCDIITVRTHGKKATGYRLIAKPPLYEYAEEVGQITTIPSLALNVPVNLDEDKTNIREYLLKHIAHLQRKNSQWNKTLTFDKIFDSVGLKIANTASGRNKKSKMVQAIKKMADHWKEIHFIKDYSVRRGNHNSAYSISFDV